MKQFIAIFSKPIVLPGQQMENIKTYGRFFYCITVFGICLVGAVIEVYRNEGSVK